MNPYFVSTTAERGHHVFAQKTGVTTRYVHVQIAAFEQGVQHFFKLVQMLNFINQNIIPTFFRFEGQDVLQNLMRVAQVYIGKVLEVNLKNMTLGIMII